MKKDSAFKLKSGNKPSVAKLMGLVNKALGRKRTVEKFPEGGKQVTITNKKGKTKVVTKGKGYRGVEKFDAQGRKTLSKSRTGRLLGNKTERRKMEMKYSDPSKYVRFPNKPLEVKVTKRKGLFGKKTVRKSERKADNRVIFGPFTN